MQLLLELLGSYYYASKLGLGGTNLCGDRTLLQTALEDVRPERYVVFVWCPLGIRSLQLFE